MGCSTFRAALSIVAVVGAWTVGITAAAAQASQETRDACTNDAMQFCSEFVPDVAKITQCMVAKHRLLSRACQAAMANEHKAKPRRGIADADDR